MSNERRPNDERRPLVDRATDLARLSPFLVAFLFFAIAVLSAMNIGVGAALETLIVGWLVVFPPTAAVVWTLFEPPEYVSWPFGGDGERKDDRDPFEVLRDRYARGELSEAEFEERVDRLLGSEAETRTRSAAEREPVSERE